MSYLISAVRNPLPGKTQQLLSTVVSDFENNIGRGIVTLGPTGIIIGNTPVESADALEKMPVSYTHLTLPTNREV